MRRKRSRCGRLRPSKKELKKLQQSSGARAGPGLLPPSGRRRQWEQQWQQQRAEQERQAQERHELEQRTEQAVVVASLLHITFLVLYSTTR